MTLLELLAHYAAQPAHTTRTEPGPDGRPWHTVTDEDGVLIDWFPATEGDAEKMGKMSQGTCNICVA